MPLITNSVVVDSVLVLLCLIVLGYLWFLRRYTYWARRGVYSPKPTIPWGNIKDLVLGRTHIGQQFEQIYYETRKHPFVGIYMIHKYALVINDPELIKSVVVKDFMHFTDHGLVHHEESEPLEGHLFNINGNRWRNVRLRLIPNFTSGKMKVMFDTVVKFGKVMQEYIEPNINMGKPVDVKETLARFSTDIVGTCVFGVETNSLLNEKAIFRNMSKKSQMLPPLRSLIQTMSLMAPKIVENLKMSMYQNDVNEFFKESAREALKHRQQNNTKNDYMQTLLKLREEREEKQRNNELLDENEDATMTLGDVAAQFFVFFVDGTETSSTAASFALFELARNPDVQETLRHEIDEVMARYDGKITYEALAEMAYLQQVVEEALRMYPPLPLLLRVCTKEYTIPNTNIVIEKGTSVMIPILGLQRDPDIYPDPMKFNPDRMSAENKVSRHKFANLPFGEGPRMCMGTRFGMLMARMGILNILSKYEVSLREHHEEPFVFKQNSFILAPLKGINVHLTKRKFK